MGVCGEGWGLRAYVFIKLAAPVNPDEVAETLRRVDEVVGIYKLLGPYDLVAEVEEPHDDPILLRDLVVEKVRPTPGVRWTVTAIVIEGWRRDN